MKQNLLIAGFMGEKIGEDKYKFIDSPMNIGDGNPVFLREAHFKYHSSWDWLMPVVEKIESLGFEFQLESRNSPVLRQGNSKISIVCISRTFKNVDEIVNKLNSTTPSDTILKYYDKPSEKREATYEAVVQFIEWYNKNHK